MKNGSASRLGWPVVVPRWLLCRAELSHGAKLTYAVMEKAADKGRTVMVRLPEVARALGEDEAEVVRLLSELIGWGLVEAAGAAAGGDPSHCFMPAHPWMREQRRDEKPSEGKAGGRGGVGRKPLSMFSLDQCLKYTARLKELGEPIRTVRGFAWHIYENGTHDEVIAALIAAKDVEDAGQEPPNVLAYRKRG